ncbi:hypothetical protein UFOVP19_10 [uncultured Caudovirales phage]|uniref:Uncharacterized protein n=1 Tax=uncultured Caudovirales phage TaxID=2100421 RepID=A0A6J5KNQ8_9CAUD|nr:hypothetical protein UFOVP19_10 [uncultured Caudovirales phage]
MSCSTTTADLRPAQYNVQIWRNDTWSQSFSITANSTPVNLTGSTIVIQIRKTATSSDIELSASTTDGSITITGTSFNEIQLKKKVTIAAGSYLYDMNVTFSSGEVKTYVWGTFFVQEDITKI